MYREHHGHYTTLCMFWTATDVMRLRIDAGRCHEAEQIMASLRHLYPNLQDKDLSAARTLNRLALQLATKEQELARQRMVGVNGTNGDSLQDGVNGANGDGQKLAWEEEPEVMQFSLLDYMKDFGVNYLTEEDWQAGEWNGHVVPSFGTKIISRIFHEVTAKDWSKRGSEWTNKADGAEDKERLEDALEMVQTGLVHAPRNKHLLRYEANLIYRLGEKEQAIKKYRQLIERSKESYLFSELAGMIDNPQEQAALLSRAIMNQRTEVFAQKDRLTLAGLLKELFPQNAAYELQRVVELRDSLGQRMNRTIQGLQQELADVAPVTMADQREFYMRLMQGTTYAA